MVEGSPGKVLGRGGKASKRLKVMETLIYWKLWKEKSPTPFKWEWMVGGPRLLCPLARSPCLSWPGVC